MKNTDASFLLRFLVVLTSGILLLTHVVQARQGLLPGGNGECFEELDIFEAEYRLTPVDISGGDKEASIIEAPLLIPALTGVFPSVDHTLASAIAGLATNANPTIHGTRRDYCGDGRQSLFFIPPLPFSSVLRL
ncbi:MAG: hypothetical protein M5R41_15065 [Bacteroidia bacterium]|nr:hypothetical protein [Bacteroidia bacterium]